MASGCVPFLQSVKITTPKSLSPEYPKELKTCGDHIRKMRLDINIEQKNVAEMISVSEATISNWECNINGPQIKFMPSILIFLGYDPFPIINDGSLESPKILIAIRNQE